jgi:hypothetical protein
MSTLEHILDNMLYEIKNKKETNKELLKKKYNELFNASEKLFDKLLEPNLNNKDLNIIRIMLKKKDEREKGDIDKLQADKDIGEVLCDTYVKPLLKKTEKKK